MSTNSMNLKDIFAQAMQLPPEERAAFIERVCGDNLTIRAEVETFMRAADGAAGAGFLASPTRETPPTTTPWAVAEKAGERVGPYKLLQLIGEGGFGSVFMAEQEKPVRRRVALKIIKLGMDTRQVIARFEAERQALAMMDHPNIARVLDAGATDAGRPYFVMELVKGDPITAYCDRNNLSISERLELFTQVCRAVQHAHTKGVIHRDIKPNNVLVATQDGRPHAKVIDFGIAKATDHRLTERTLFTEHKALIGTPEYMSPEQAEGSLDIDTRTDVYSLGVLLYELLTGSTPFDSRQLRSAAYGEVQRIIREVEPPKPSTRIVQSIQASPEVAARRRVEPNRLGGQVRGELDWIVMKSLEKDRARRYETANALAADVARHLSGEPVEAAPPSAAYRLRKFVRKHRTGVLAGSAVAAALVLGIAGTTLQWRQTDAQRRIAQTALESEAAQRIRAEEQTRFAEAATSQEGRAREEAEAQRRQADEQRDRAETETYAANIAFAQFAMVNANWPEARDRLEACPQGKRGWEWRFLKQKANAVFAEFPDALDAAFSPDGTRMLTASKEIAQLWNFAGNPVLEMRHNKDYYVRSAVFSSDGTRVLTASSDNTARLWDLAGHQLAELRIGPNVRSALLSPDGTHVLTVRYDGIFCMWDLEGKQLAEVRHGYNVSSAIFSPDGTRVLTASDDGTARMWDLAGHQLAELRHDSSRVRSAVFSPDGTRVLTASWDKTARMWDLVGHQLAELRHDGAVESAVFSPDGTRVLTASLARTDSADRYALIEGNLRAASIVRMWDLAGNPVAEMRHEGMVRLAVFSPDGTRILTASDDDMDGTVCMGDLAGRCLGIAPLQGDLKDYGVAATFSPDGQWVLLRSQLTQLVRANQLDRPQWSIDPLDQDIALAALLAGNQNGAAMTVVLSPTRRATISGGKSLRFIDASTDREVAVMSLPATATALNVTPDGTRLIIQLADTRVLVWDSRELEARVAEAQAIQAERELAERYVDTLLAGPTPRESLRDAMRKDLEGTPARWLAAGKVLRERLAKIDAEAVGVFDRMAKEHFTAARMNAALQAPDSLGGAPLPPRVHAVVLKRAADWTPDAEWLHTTVWAIIRWPSTPEKLDAALEAAREAIHLAPQDPYSLKTLGAALYRHGDYAGALAVLEKSKASAWETETDYAALIAMCQVQLGLHEEAQRSLAQLRESIPNQNRIDGQVSERTLTFRYSEALLDGSAVSGEGRFDLSQDGQSFTGSWRTAPEVAWQNWNGIRKSGDAARFDGIWSTTGGEMWLFTDGEQIRGSYGVDNLVSEAITLMDGPSPSRTPREVAQWASRVIAFSSQYGDPRYAASQALGEPDTYGYRDAETAWAPWSQTMGIQFLSLGFRQPVYAMGVTVRETFCNGFVMQIDVLDEADTLHTVWKGNDPSRPGTPVDFFIPFERTSFLVKGIKIYVDTSHCESWEEIDAVKLHGISPAAVDQ